MLDIKSILQAVPNALDMNSTKDIQTGKFYLNGITRAFILLREEAEDALEELSKCLTLLRQKSEDEL